MATVPVTIEELKRQTGSEYSGGSVHAQIDEVATRRTKDQKTYLEILLRDGTASFPLRVWSDHPSRGFCSELRNGDFVEVQGDFIVTPAFGLEARNWNVRILTAAEKDELLTGPPEVQKKQSVDYSAIESFIASIRDPRLRELSLLFLREFEDRLRRAAGARRYHHARRGGLVEHIAQMMRACDALAAIYTALNRDLLLTGILFHDSGKLWENCFPKESFIMPHDFRAELVGHVSMGVELVNRLWHRLKEGAEFSSWNVLSPDSDLVRLHLLHLVASHHGEKQFGSPVEPKTPEAMTLHLIDNLDAKLEMMSSNYQLGKRLGPEVIERIRPLPANLVAALPAFSEEA
ncbi:MAG: HD domain-containing protein [Verrucomicrobia bacterium]|nr:HD domain-containing protein [Verrucomicrobiota bacterium]